MNALFLLTLSGQGNPDQSLEKVLAALAEAGARIIDITHSAIREQLMFTAVVSLSENSGLSERLKQRLRAEGFSFRLKPLELDAHQQYLAQQALPGYVITLLAIQLNAHDLSRLMGLVRSAGLSIADLYQLTHPSSLSSEEGVRPMVLELLLRGQIKDIGQLKSSLMKLATELGIDLAFQDDNLFRRNRRLVVFDMDSTLITNEVIDELALCAGVGEQVAKITERAMGGEIPFQESLIERVRMLKGLSAEVLPEVAKKLSLAEGAERLVATVKRLGFRTAIISGGFEYFGEILKRQLGIDYLYAHKLQIVGGVLTGEIEGDIIDGQGKAELLKQIAETEGLDLQQVIAVGDGANDLPMLGIAGLGIAYRAQPLIRRNAKQAMSEHGLDGILYMLGITDSEIHSLDPD